MAEPGVEVGCVSVCLVFAFGKISSQTSRSNKGETGNVAFEDFRASGTSESLLWSHDALMLLVFAQV